MPLSEHQISRLYDQARQYSEDGKHLHAAQVYQRIIQEHPEILETYFLLADSYLQLRNVAAAEQILLTALRESPDHPDIIFALGSLHVKAGNLDEALQYFDQLIPLRQPKVHFNIGLVYYLKQNPAAAERQFRIAVEYEPDYPKGWQLLGEVLLKMERGEEAIEPLQRAIAFDPDSWVLHASLGAACASAGLMDEAAASYQRALEIQPGDADTLRQYADLLIRRGETERAEQCLRKAWSIDKSSSEIQASFALLALSRSDKRMAKKHFSKALELDENNVRALEGLQLLQPDDRPM
jgi:tetratricopeptide (TPR) repeat protein